MPRRCCRRGHEHDQGTAAGEAGPVVPEGLQGEQGEGVALGLQRRAAWQK